MPDYEAEGFAPSAPIARAIVRSPAGQTRSGVPLLIDTGADVSTIPRLVAEQVAAEVQPAGILIRSFDGSEVTCDVAQLTVEFLRYRFQGAFVIVEAEYGVLGRNILNSLLLTLDGPRQVWSA